MSAYAKRRRKVRDWLQANGVDAILVTSAANVRYLSGFGGEGMVVIGTDAVLCTDRRYEIEAGAVPGRVKVQLHPGGHLGGVIEALNSTKAKRVAFEAESTLYSSYENLTARLDGIETVPVRGVIEQLRAVKDRTEVDAIRRAAAIMDKSLQQMASCLEPGMTEREVALDLDRATILAGSEGMAFDTIAAFGPSAAHPHAVPGARKLKLGHMVKIDCGARVDGYCSDITRTYIVGTPGDQLRQIYQAVFDAQWAACEAAKPGMNCRDLDAVARDIITQRGFGEQFGHGLGHGVGLQVHELPRVSSRSEDVLKPGMVVTIEPGIYIEGFGGVRIEDTVVITRSGCEPLTLAPKQQLDP